MHPEQKEQIIMDDRKLPWDGGCRCGQVRLRISAKPILTMACHCTGCQKMAASAYSLSAAIPSDGFAIIQGEPVIGGLHGASRHYFCPYCMSWMFTRPDGIDSFVNLRPTMLDEPSWFVPFIETWTSEKLSWVSTPAVHSYKTLPAFDEYEGLVKEYLTRAG
ncbi:GFA family protein [Stigmatella sp. ncwal1]|uniref:GFA family protein n=1 Tax=Stigmatella ashevillensis TaxID=2995309 RepID=A0ABT5DAY9_9BACT|nr:GFA family protein [Stigmatella ashevillena]MDC0709456.1 GFA family protein [Stigmatella ashevillena]